MGILEAQRKLRLEILGEQDIAENTKPTKLMEWSYFERPDKDDIMEEAKECEVPLRYHPEQSVMIPRSTANNNLRLAK